MKWSKRRDKKEKGKTEPNPTKPLQCNAMKGNWETRGKTYSFALTHTAQTLNISVDCDQQQYPTYKPNIPF